MERVIAVGSAPSSGSTLLADLLDSTPYTAAGPELGLFSVSHFYEEYERFQKRWFKTAKSRSLYYMRSAINKANLAAYGFNKKSFDTIVQSAGDHREFLERFALHFLSLRGKSVEGMLFEKTPQNLEYIGKNLGFGRRFVVIVRNPAQVYLSLRKRGFAPAIALLTWFLEMARVAPYLGHPNLVLVRYEELTASPYETAADIIARCCGIKVDPGEMEAYHADNAYRIYHSQRLPTWSVQDSTKVVPSKKRVDEESRRALATLYSLRISKKYAALLGVEEYRFEDLLELFGYKESFLEQVPKRGGERFALDGASRRFLWRKMAIDLLHGDFRPQDVAAYLGCVEQVG